MQVSVTRTQTISLTAGECLLQKLSIVPVRLLCLRWRRCAFTDTALVSPAWKQAPSNENFNTIYRMVSVSRRLLFSVI